MVKKPALEFEPVDPVYLAEDAAHKANNIILSKIDNLDKFLNHKTFSHKKEDLHNLLLEYGERLVAQNIFALSKLPLDLGLYQHATEVVYWDKISSFLRECAKDSEWMKHELPKVQVGGAMLRDINRNIKQVVSDLVKEELGVGRGR